MRFGTGRHATVSHAAIPRRYKVHNSSLEANVSTRETLCGPYGRLPRPHQMFGSPIYGGLFGGWDAKAGRKTMSDGHDRRTPSPPSIWLCKEVPANLAGIFVCAVGNFLPYLVHRACQCVIRTNSARPEASEFLVRIGTEFRIASFHLRT